MSQQQPNEPHTSSALPGVACMNDVFTTEECQTIRDYHQKWRRADGKVTSQSKPGEDASGSGYRVCQIYNPSTDAQRDALGWCTQRLIEAIQAVNDGYYRFEIKALLEAPNLMRYDAGDHGHYDYHLDIGRNRPNCWRKLSYSLFLNDGFEGGELEFMTGEDLIQHKGPVGTLVLFPSYLLHRVNVVTSGTRWVMVGWAHGDSFR